MRDMSRAIRLAALVLASVAFAASANAQYPDRPIKLIVAYPAGGSGDSAARIVSGKLERALGRPIFIENVSGAGGAIGAQRAIAAPPDGYTLYMGANSELLVNKAIQPQLPYDAVRDLKPIGLVATSPILLIGSNELPPKTWPEFLSFASSRSQMLTYGTAGIGSIVHLGGEMLTLKAKLTLTQVPYR